MSAAPIINTFIHVEVLSKNAKHISVPHYDKLTLETIKEFCRLHPNQVDNYLPDSRELHKISR